MNETEISMGAGCSVYLKQENSATNEAGEADGEFEISFESGEDNLYSSESDSENADNSSLQAGKGCCLYRVRRQDSINEIDQLRTDPTEPVGVECHLDGNSDSDGCFSECIKTCLMIQPEPESDDDETDCVQD